MRLEPEYTLVDDWEQTITVVYPVLSLGSSKQFQPFTLSYDDWMRRSYEQGRRQNPF
jgi:hypothetical protein